MFNRLTDINELIKTLRFLTKKSFLQWFCFAKTGVCRFTELMTENCKTSPREKRRGITNWAWRKTSPSCLGTAPKTTQTWSGPLWVISIIHNLFFSYILSCFVHLIKSVKKRNKIATMWQECVQQSIIFLICKHWYITNY